MITTEHLKNPPRHDESIMQSVKNSARGKHALTILDIVDQKVSALFTLTSILVAATLVVASIPEKYVNILFHGYAISQTFFVYAGLAFSVTSAVLAMSCLWIIDLFRICKRASDEHAALTKIYTIARSRLVRYRLSWIGTLISLAFVTIAVTMSILEPQQ